MDKTIQEEAGLDPQQWQVVDAAPIRPSQPSAPVPNATGNYYTGSLSGVLQHDIQLVDTQYQTPRISSTPLMPLSFSGLASANSAAQSVSKSISQQVVNETFTQSAVELQTNGSDNSIQSKLNLASGTGGIVLTPGSGGMVTISETVMGPSGAGHAAGAVPDPGPVAGTTKFLREDAQFVVPPNNTILETNSVLNSSQTTLNLTAGSGMTLTPGVGGLVTFATSGSSSTPISSFQDAPLSTNVIVGSSPTAINAITVNFPASGGPFRVFISYSLYVNFVGFSNEAEIVFWVDDGSFTNQAGVQTGQSNASTGGRTSAVYGGFSPTTYNNNDTKTFTLIGLVGASGFNIQQNASIGSGPASDFQITVFRT